MEKCKKYILTDEKKDFFGNTLSRIEAIRSFSDVEKGDKGGWVSSEHNLSHEGNSWVYGDAKVFGSAKVCGDAEVYGDARVFGDA